MPIQRFVLLGFAFLSDAAVTSLWEDLASDDATKAYEAVVLLAERGEQTISMLRRRLRPVAEPDARHVTRLIDGLDADDFDIRQQSHRELEALAELATPALRRALEKEPSPEVRRRLTELLERAEKRPHSSNMLRGIRAVEVLERIGTPGARDVLTMLASGAPAARLTQEARASVQRLGRRPR